MNTKSFLLVLACLTVVSCSKGTITPGEEEQPNEEQGTVSIDKIVTDAAQSVTNPQKVYIYKDYGRRYYLSTVALGPAIYVEVRNSFGKWWGHISESNIQYGIMTMGQFNSISEVTEGPDMLNRRVEGSDSYTPGGIWSPDYYSSRNGRYSKFYPKTGYCAWFSKEDGTVVDFRIYASDYTLDSSDNVSSVTYQYQLY